MLANAIDLWAGGIKYGATLSANLLSSTTLPSWITFSRPSLATMFDSTGKLTYCPNNLVTQSNTFSNAAWTKGSSTITAGTATLPDGNQAATLGASTTNTLPSIAGTSTVGSGTVLVSVKAKANQAGFVIVGFGNNPANAAVWFNLNTGVVGTEQGSAVTANMAALANGFYLCSVTAVAAAGASSPSIYAAQANGSLSWSGSIGDGIYIGEVTSSQVTYETTPRPQDQVITTSAAYYGPCIEYDPVTLAPKGLSIWEARINSQPSSQLFNVAQYTTSASALTFTDAAGTSPEGISNAGGVMETATNTTHYTSTVTSITVANNTTVTQSIFVKPNGRSWFWMRTNNSLGNHGSNFNITTGAIGTVIGTPNTILPPVSIGGGWYRVSISCTNASGSSKVTSITFGLSDADNNFNYMGDITKGAYIYGAQTENAAAFPTSYIPTAASEVARSADVVTLTGAALDVVKGAAASIILETGAANLQSSGNTRYVSETTSNRDLLATNGVTTTGLFSQSMSGGNLNATLGPGSLKTSARLGLSWSAGGKSLVGNGGTVGTDPTAMGAITSVSLFSNSYNGSSQINGYATRVNIYNFRLPGAILQAKSV